MNSIKNAVKKVVNYVQNPWIKMSEYDIKSLVSMSTKEDYVAVSLVIPIGSPEEVTPEKGQDWKPFTSLGQLTLDSNFETPFGLAKFAVIKPSDPSKSPTICIRLVTSTSREGTRLKI